MKKILTPVIGVILLVLWFAISANLGKWDDGWADVKLVHVLIPGAIFIALVFHGLYYLLYDKSYVFSEIVDDNSFILPMLIVLLFILFVGGGIYMTEPVAEIARWDVNTSIDDNDGFRNSRVGSYWFFYYPRYFGSLSSSDSDSYVPSSSSSSDDLATAIIVCCACLFLLMLLFGSLFLPHFWVISSLGLVIFALTKFLSDSDTYSF